MKTDELNRLLMEAIKEDLEPLQVFVPQWQYDEMKALGYDVDALKGGIQVIPFKPFTIEQ